MYDSLRANEPITRDEETGALGSVISPVLQCWKFLIFLDKEFVWIKKMIALYGLLTLAPPGKQTSLLGVDKLIYRRNWNTIITQRLAWVLSYWTCRSRVHAVFLFNEGLLAAFQVHSLVVLLPIKKVWLSGSNIFFLFCDPLKQSHVYLQTSVSGGISFKGTLYDI